MESHQKDNENMGFEFTPGSQVVYGLHGRCSISSIELRNVNGQSIAFYKLQPQRPPLSRSKKLDPAIWLPVASARRQGLRAPMTAEEVEQAFKILSNKEYYFSVEEPWIDVQTKIEKLINEEGAIGLAKAESYLYVLRKRQIVPTAEVSRFSETVRKILTREISELTHDPLKAIEEKMDRHLRHKLTPDN